jgi:hypothetical protein
VAVLEPIQLRGALEQIPYLAPLHQTVAVAVELVNHRQTTKVLRVGQVVVA